MISIFVKNIKLSGIKYLCFPGKSVVRPNWEKKFTGLVKGGCLWGKEWAQVAKSWQ